MNLIYVYHFKFVSENAIDEVLIPVEIKNQYLKQIETWIENLVVNRLS